MKDLERKKTLNEDHIRLGKRIRELRKRCGYTSYERFANSHDITRTQMGRFEKGENITYNNLLKIIRALGVTPQEFFSEGFEDFK